MTPLPTSLRSCGMFLLFLLASSCVTPLGPSEIQNLTTCRHTTLKAVRKNLLLAGYHIARESDEDIITEYKQVSGGRGGARSLMRITVVKIDDQTLRFMPRHKDEGYESIQTSETLSTARASGHDAAGPSVHTAHSHMVKNENEYDESYYQEYLPRYESLKALVCGAR